LEHQFDHLTEGLENLEVGYPKDKPTVADEPFVALCISLGVVRHVVNLDDQPMRPTREVGNVRANRVLTTKADTENAVLDFPPEPEFRKPWVTSILSSEPNEVIPIHASTTITDQDRFQRLRPGCQIAPSLQGK
jgi:hypothetical protein